MKNYKVVVDYGGVVPVKADGWVWDTEEKMLRFFRNSNYEHDNVACFDLNRVMYVVEVDDADADE